MPAPGGKLEIPGFDSLSGPSAAFLKYHEAVDGNLQGKIIRMPADRHTGWLEPA
ncbi:hypothetical protein GF318_04935 [Candidatus Micrarchaeota archaeon]|nr:hypothetical protein [Candidatus Micrarchaeota archaeon]